MIDELRELFRDLARNNQRADLNREPQPVEPQPQPPLNGFGPLREEMLREMQRLRVLMGRDHHPEASPLRAIQASPDERLTPADRKYYRQQGFDPFLDVIIIPNTPGYYKYEYTFELKHDPPLKEAGVTIGARVEVQDRIHNRIFFRRGNKESTVDCVHTAICTLGVQDAFALANSIEDDPNNARPLLERVVSTELRPVQLPPEEHFVSLKSYVAGIAEMGLSQVMFAAYHSDGVNPETLPFGFNSHLQRQIAQALHEVAPVPTLALVRDLVIDLVQNVPEDWFRTRLRLLDEMYNVKACILTDPTVFDAVYSAAPCQELLLFGAQFHNIHPAILEQIAKLGDSHVKAELVKNHTLSKEKLAEFAQDPLLDVRLGVARHKKAPAKTLRLLGRDSEFSVRKAVAQNANTTGDTLEYLSNDRDASVRISVLLRIDPTQSLSQYIQATRQDPETIPRSYFGVRLPSAECIALADLEWNVGPEITPVTSLGAKEVGFIARSDHVVELRITQNNLQILPPSIGNFTYLQVLDLSCNHLTELPPSLARLQQLRILDLGANELTIVPPFFDLWISIIGPRGCLMRLLQRNKTRIHSGVASSTPENESHNSSFKYFEVMDPSKEATMISLRREMLQELRQALGRHQR